MVPLKFEYGINAGAQSDTSMVSWVEQSGATWVRLNFIVYSDQSGPNDPSFQSMYDNIINAYIASDIKVYGLIGSESVKSGYDRNDPQSFIEPFTNATIEIISRYKDKVSVYEIFNEPNDWNGGNSAQLPSIYFAQIMASIYQQKINYKWNNVKIISGPLFSFDQNTASSYLYDTYTKGIDNYGWEDIYNSIGQYPLDGIGYHIYDQGGSTNSKDITNSYQYNLKDIWNNGVIKGETYKHSDNNVTGKKFLWISEFGWQSGDVGENGQSDDLYTVYTNVFPNNDNVAVAMWFTLMDFGTSTWGLLAQNGTHIKPGWLTYQNLTSIF